MGTTKFEKLDGIINQIIAPLWGRIKGDEKMRKKQDDAGDLPHQSSGASDPEQIFELPKKVKLYEKN